MAKKLLTIYVNILIKNTMAQCLGCRKQRRDAITLIVLWPDAKSAIVMGLNYGPYVDPLISLKDKEKASISVYARNQDYHKIIKGRLKEIGGLIARDTGKDIKVFVDTAPLMEKPLAAAAGLGWQGKAH
jgi:epoxyqueuosine reductase